MPGTDARLQRVKRGGIGEGEKVKATWVGSSMLQELGGGRSKRNKALVGEGCWIESEVRTLVYMGRMALLCLLCAILCFPRLFPNGTKFFKKWFEKVSWNWPMLLCWCYKRAEPLWRNADPLFYYWFNFFIPTELLIKAMKTNWAGRIDPSEVNACDF